MDNSLTKSKAKIAGLMMLFFALSSFGNDVTSLVSSIRFNYFSAPMLFNLLGGFISDALYLAAGIMMMGGKKRSVGPAIMFAVICLFDLITVMRLLIGHGNLLISFLYFLFDASLCVAAFLSALARKGARPVWYLPVVFILAVFIVNILRSTSRYFDMEVLASFVLRSYSNILGILAALYAGLWMKTENAPRQVNAVNGSYMRY